MSVTHYTTVAVPSSNLSAAEFVAAVAEVARRVGKQHAADIVALGSLFAQAREKCAAEGIPYMDQLTDQTGYTRVTITKMMRVAERLAEYDAAVVSDVPISALYEWVAPSTTDEQLDAAIASIAAGATPQSITARIRAERPPSNRRPKSPAQAAYAAEANDLGRNAPDIIEAEFEPSRARADSAPSVPAMPPVHTAGDRTYAERIARLLALAARDRTWTAADVLAAMTAELGGPRHATNAARMLTSIVDRLTPR